MTPSQRAEYAEWARQRANDLQLLDAVDWHNPELEKLLSGEDQQIYLCSASLMGMAAHDLRQAQRNFVTLAERIEANAD